MYLPYVAFTWSLTDTWQQIDRAAKMAESTRHLTHKKFNEDKKKKKTEDYGIV